MPRLTWTQGPSPEALLATLQLAEAAAAMHPDNLSVRLALGNALGRVGAIERAVDVLDEVFSRLPGSEPARVSLAHSLRRAGETDRALALIDDAADRRLAAAFSLETLVRAGRFDEAARFEAKVAATHPFASMVIECRLRRLRDDPDAMIGFCDALLLHRPGDSRAIHHKAIASAQLGDVEKATTLMDIDQYLSDIRLPHLTRADFLKNLASEIAGAPDLRPDPAGHATVGGLRTRTFPRAADRASAALIHRLREAVEDYAESLSGSHPFVDGCPSTASFHAWALVFPSVGRQTIHYHPEAWATGVFYIAAPDTAGDAGSIRIGVPPSWAGIEPPWPVRILKPEPGRLLLFPSYVPHDTVPTGVAGERIAVAFDVTAV